MKLSNASMGIRKAAWANSIKNGTWKPFFDTNEGDSRIIAIVTSSNGKKEVQLSAGEVVWSEAQTWQQIKAQGEE